MKFRDKFYQSHWHDTLAQFRSEGVLCDVTLVAEGKEFPAHKLILCSFSPYFRAMFNFSTFIDSREDKIMLNGIDKIALAEILNFMYTSCIDINDDNIFPLIDTINLMQIHTLRIFISFYLENSLTPSNCLIYYAMGNLYQYFDFGRKALNYALRNFSDVVKTQEYLQIPFETMYKIVSSRLLDVDSEDRIVESIFKWVDYDVDKRKIHVELLLSKIQLGQLSIITLHRLQANPLLPPEMQEDAREIEQIRMTSGGCIRSKVPLCKRIRHKLERDVIFTIGGETSGKPTVSVECFTKGYHRWKSFVPVCVFRKCSEKHTMRVPPLKLGRSEAACTTDGFDKIFVIGGRNPPHLLDQCEVYDITSNQWQFFKKYPLKICGTGAAYMDNKLYVAGGSTKAGVTAKVYVMDVNVLNQVWREIPSLSKPRCFHSLISVGGHIYAIGGYDSNGIPLRTCERYDPGSNKWTAIASLKEGRAKFGCTAYEEYIYVFGGTTFECDTLKTVEKYNVLNDEWEVDTPMPLPRQCLSACVFENNIYCIGGSNSIYALDCVDKFNIRTKHWHWEESLQYVRLSPCAATLKVSYVRT